MTERLQEENKRDKHSIRLLEKDMQTAKAEVIKELAERLERIISISDTQKVYFDNLVKEMENSEG